MIDSSRGHLSPRPLRVITSRDVTYHVIDALKAGGWQQDAIPDQSAEYTNLVCILCKTKELGI